MIDKDTRVRDKGYLGWIARLPCCGCWVEKGVINHEVQVAHLRAGSPEHDKPYTGGQTKPSDRWTLPLCYAHHQGDKRRVRIAQHQRDELDFWAALGIDPFDLCVALQRAYAANRSGVMVIAAFIARRAQ